MTKTIVLFFMMIFTLASCNSNNKKNSNQKSETTMSTPMELAGKNLEYNYGDYVYQLNFLTDDKLHWKCVKGDEKGKEADETYVTQRLNDHTLFVSWIEADGLGVSQVINLKKNKINCYLKIDKEIVPLSGTIREL